MRTSSVYQRCQQNHELTFVLCRPPLAIQHQPHHFQSTFSHWSPQTNQSTQEWYWWCKWQLCLSWNYQLNCWRRRHFWGARSGLKKCGLPVLPRPTTWHNSWKRIVCQLPNTCAHFACKQDCANFSAQPPYGKRKFSANQYSFMHCKSTADAHTRITNRTSTSGW